MRQWHVVAYGSMAGTDAVRAKNIMKTHKKRIKVSRGTVERRQINWISESRKSILDLMDFTVKIC